MIFSKRNIKEWLTAGAVGIILLAGIPALERLTAPSQIALSSTYGEMTLIVFDVGQGDAILAQVGNKQILIDGGPNDAVLEKLGNAMPPGDREIDLVVLTHPHADHVNGLVSVLERYRVDKILATDVIAPIAGFRRWQELIARNDIVVDDPQKIKSEKVGGMEFDVLSAGTQTSILRSEHDGNSDGLNDSSIVGMLKFGAKKFLLMGDATTVIEDAILRQAFDTAQADNNNVMLSVSKHDLNADFLKVGHHGSNYSTGDEFIKAVSPSYSAISVGAKNSYGNPAWRVVQLLLNKGIVVYRTDENGDVVVVTDGTSLQVASEKIK